jgi:hypothetical protein
VLSDPMRTRPFTISIRLRDDLASHMSAVACGGGGGGGGGCNAHPGARPLSAGGPNGFLGAGARHPRNPR